MMRIDERHVYINSFLIHMKFDTTLSRLPGITAHMSIDA